MGIDIRDVLKLFFIIPMVRAGKYAFGLRDIWEQFLTSSVLDRSDCFSATIVVGGQTSSSSEAVGHISASLSFSGSNQAREGRLVNALAVRGDERRDTLR